MEGDTALWGNGRVARMDGLGELALANARRALDAGEPFGALEWLQRVPPGRRPSELSGTVAYESAKREAERLRWEEAEELLRSAVQAVRCGLFSERLRCHRARGPLMEAARWESLDRTVHAAERLSPDALRPEVAEVYACGAYYSRGSLRSMPWSQLLRLAKEPDSEQDHAAALKIATDYLCQFLLRRTPLVARSDAVVAIPANPMRFAKRMMSLPDELARGIEQDIGIPFLFQALKNRAQDVELRGLTWAERRRAVRESMACGDLGIGKGRNLLVVDDVMTSGATLREAARVLREGGAGQVSALSLCHTEG